jgi:membrane-associated PAP2 superfamily phosphatase
VAPSSSSTSLASPAEPADAGTLQLLVSVGLLVSTLLVFELTPLDLWFQDHFFDFETGRWWVDASAAGPKALFYVGPKALLILFGLGMITLFLGPERLRQALHLDGRRKAMGVVILVLAIGPAMISGLKAATNVFCPAEMTRYGGDIPYSRVFNRSADVGKPDRRGRCFPAGHASGGFALVSLAGLGRSRRGQRLGLSLGLAAGGWMGGYQMLKGAHFLSHTLVTACLMWILFIVCKRLTTIASRTMERRKNEK